MPGPFVVAGALATALDAGPLCLVRIHVAPAETNAESVTAITMVFVFAFIGSVIGQSGGPKARSRIGTVAGIRALQAGTRPHQEIRIAYIVDYFSSRDGECPLSRQMQAETGR